METYWLEKLLAVTIDYKLSFEKHIRIYVEKERKR